MRIRSTLAQCGLWCAALAVVSLLAAAPADASQADIDAWKTYYAKRYFPKTGVANERTPSNTLNAADNTKVDDWLLKVVRLRMIAVNSQYKQDVIALNFTKPYAHATEKLWFGSDGDGFTSASDAASFAKEFAAAYYPTWGNWLDLIKDEVIEACLRAYYAYLHWPAAVDRGVHDEQRAREAVREVLKDMYPGMDWDEFLRRAQSNPNFQRLLAAGEAFGTRVGWLRHVIMHEKTWSNCRAGNFNASWDRVLFGASDGGFANANDASTFATSFKREFSAVYANWTNTVSEAVIRAWWRQWYAGLYTPLVDFDETEARRRTRQFCGMDRDAFLAMAERHPSYTSIKEDMENGFGVQTRLLRGLVLDLRWWREARAMDYNAVWNDRGGKRLFTDSRARGFSSAADARTFKDVFCSEFQDVYDGWTRGLPPDFILLAYRCYYAGLYSPSGKTTDENRAKQLVQERCGMSWDDIQAAIRNDPRAKPFADSMKIYGDQVHTLRELCCESATRYDAYELLNFGAIWSDPDRRAIATQFNAFTAPNEIQVFATAFKTEFTEVWDGWTERVTQQPGARGQNWTFRVEVIYVWENGNEETQSSLESTFASKVGEAVTAQRPQARVNRPSSDLGNTPISTLEGLGTEELAELVDDMTVNYVVVGRVYVRFSSKQGPIQFFKGEVSCTIINLTTGSVEGTISVSPTTTTTSSHQNANTAVRSAFDKTANAAKREMNDLLD